MGAMPDAGEMGYVFVYACDVALQYVRTVSMY